MITVENTVPIGGRVRMWQRALMPPETVVTFSNGGGQPARYRREGDHWRMIGVTEGYDRTYSDADMPSGITVESYPDGYVPAQPVPERLVEYVWRFSQTAVRARRDSGISTGSVNAILRELGCDPDRMPPGPGLRVWDDALVGRSPNGSLFQVGTPEVIDSFGLFTRKDHNLRHVLGRAPHLNARYSAPLIVRWGEETEPPQWWQAWADEGDGIERFKANAWVLGWKAKRDNGWCSTFETIMTGLDIDHTAVLRLQPLKTGRQILEQDPMGSVVHTEAGSLFRVAPQGSGRYLEPVVLLPNQSHRSNEPFGRVVWAPGRGEMNIPFRIGEHWDHVPVGTVWTYSGSRYVMGANHQASSHYIGHDLPTEGGWGVDSFRTALTTYIVGFDNAVMS